MYPSARDDEKIPEHGDMGCPLAQFSVINTLGRVCDKLIRTVRGAMWRVAESTDMVRVRHILSDKLLRDDHRDIEKKT